MGETLTVLLFVGLVVVAAWMAVTGYLAKRSADGWKYIAEDATKREAKIEQWCQYGPTFTETGVISYDPETKWFSEEIDGSNPHRPGTPEWWDAIDGEQVQRTLSGIFRHVERLIPEARARVYHELASLYCDYCGRDLHVCLDDRCEGYSAGAPPAWVYALARRARTATLDTAAQAIYDALGQPEHPPTPSEVTNG